MLCLHMFSNGTSILMCIKRLCGNFQYVMTTQKELMVLVICINSHFSKVSVGNCKFPGRGVAWVAAQLNCPSRNEETLTEGKKNTFELSFPRQHAGQTTIKPSKPGR